MTKVVIPQIEDFVQGQKLTEQGHKSLNDLSDKVETLEGVATESLSDTVDDLNERVATLEIDINRLPVVEIIENGDDLEINVENYTYFEVSCVFTVPAGANLSSYGIYYVDPTSTNINVSRSTYNQGSEIIVTATAIYRSHDFEYGCFLRPYSAHNSTSSQKPVPFRWIIRKYKSEY